MIPLGSRVAQLQHKTVFNSIYVNPVCCAASLGLVRVLKMTTPQGLDMSLLWVPRGHVALLASAVLEGTLPECGPINGFLGVQITVVSLMISMVNLYPHPRHTRKGDRNLNPESIVLGPIFHLQARLALRLRATSALYRSKYRILSNLRSSCKRRFFAPQNRATQGMPKQKNFSRRAL